MYSLGKQVRCMSVRYVQNITRNQEAFLVGVPEVKVFFDRKDMTRTHGMLMRVHVCEHMLRCVRVRMNYYFHVFMCTHFFHQCIQT